jgi:hypothetical protein
VRKHFWRFQWECYNAYSFPEAEIGIPMVQIAVSDDLAREISQAGPLVTLVDPRGHALGQFTSTDEMECPHGMTTERWKEIRRRVQEPGNYVPYQAIKDRLA